MHLIERLFDGDKTKTLTTSVILDLRDHVSMSLQISGIGGNTAVLHGTLFEKENFLPIKLEGATTISSDGIYIVPPYYRFYKLVINRINQAPIKAFFYAVKQGAFLQGSSGSVTSDGEIDSIRKGSQKDLFISNQILSDTMTSLPGSILIPAISEAYISHIIFNVTDYGGALVEIYGTDGGNDVTLFQYSLTGASPTIIDPIYLLEKIEHGGLAYTIKVRAKKFIYNYNSYLTGRVTLLTK